MIVKRKNSILDKDIRQAVKILKENNLSGFNAGPGDSFYGGTNVQALEKEFCDYFKCKFAISVNSWTSGLEIAVASLELEKGSEIICSPWSMSATVAAIVQNGCVPVFVDVDHKTFNLDPNKIESAITKKTGAILVTEMYGQSSHIDAILKIAKEHKLYTVSDTAQAIGSKVRGRHTGTFTDIGGFSFNWHKHINCGEGGMIITNNKKFAKRMALARNHGEGLGGKFGHNYRMTEICASLVRQQLPRLESVIKERNKIANALKDKIYNDDVEFPKIHPGHSHVYCTLPLLIGDTKFRDKIYNKLRLMFPIRKTFSRGPLNLLKACSKYRSSMPEAEKIPKHLLDIDMNYEYSPRDIELIAYYLNDTYSHNKY